jgi:hypothetical protein
MSSAASSVSQSIQAVNSILQMTTKKSIDAAEKLMKVTVASAVGAETGKGANFDVEA